MRVLIADDQRDAADTLALLCEAWGHQPVVAYEGGTALNQLRQPNAPMLCLLDWQMPGLTGVDLCQMIRREHDRPYRYVILVTARADRVEMLAGLNAGADDFLRKPFDADELRARLTTGIRVLNLQDHLLRTLRQLQEQATRDSLTKLWNRSAIFEMLERELSRRDRHNHPVSIVLCDLDHFKAINDTYGHLVGDQVLRELAHRMQDDVRPYDAVGRLGGEEFLIVLPGCDRAEASALAERLRRGIDDNIVDAVEKIRTTASFGVATWNGEASTADFVRAADDAMYVAKRAGRNRVVVAENSNGTAKIA